MYLVVDVWYFFAELFNDIECICQFLMDVILGGGVIFIDLCVYQFSFYGVMVIVILVEFYIVIYIWFELGYFVVDLFFCGYGNLYKVIEIL